MSQDSNSLVKGLKDKSWEVILQSQQYTLMGLLKFGKLNLKLQILKKSKKKTLSKYKVFGGKLLLLAQFEKYFGSMKELVDHIKIQANTRIDSRNGIIQVLLHTENKNDEIETLSIGMIRMQRQDPSRDQQNEKYTKLSSELYSMETQKQEIKEEKLGGQGQFKDIKANKQDFHRNRKKPQTNNINKQKIIEHLNGRIREVNQQFDDDFKIMNKKLRSLRQQASILQDQIASKQKKTQRILKYLEQNERDVD